jgi:hypothetical protein
MSPPGPDLTGFGGRGALATETVTATVTANTMCERSVERTASLTLTRRNDCVTVAPEDLERGVLPA